jgi:GntP family gluconate:H+ symporter
MLLVSMLLAILILPAKDIIPVITQGFGDTMKSIGIIIILGIMIGVILEKTGATISMANTLLKLTGKNKAGYRINRIHCGDTYIRQFRIYRPEWLE